MKTFEERYTAWIDGELDGSAVVAFEQELVRRAAECEAAADKADALLLRELLQTHLQAPALTNPDFFNHQLRERIDAESTTSPRGREGNRRAEPGIFAWGLARMIGLGAMSLFAAAALYYGMMPAHPGSATDSGVVKNMPVTDRAGTRVADAVPPSPAPDVAMPESNPPTGGNIQLALLSPTPSPIDVSPDIKMYVPDQPTNSTTITPLHYSQPNVNVLWLHELDYLPNYPGSAPTLTPPVPMPATPSGNVNP